MKDKPKTYKAPWEIDGKKTNMTILGYERKVSFSFYVTLFSFRKF